MFSPNKKGFYDVFGNIWEWCEDHFNGLPGSTTHYLYDDFSTPCYDGRHNLVFLKKNLIDSKVLLTNDQLII